MKLNPDSTVLQQLDGHWQRLFAILLWKAYGREKVTVKLAEIVELHHAEFGAEGPVIYTHGHFDSIDFQLVTREAALVLAAHDRTMQGTA